MAVSGIVGIENMLQQMRAVVRAAQSTARTAADLSPLPVSTTSFANELQQSIRRISAAQNAATAQSKAFELGVPEVSLNDVMIDLQKASLGFQTAVQVRNRLVAAYKEISSMSI